jgi:murein DD-endopeptidase MepM/ murein hydrolase activator NlpD
MSSSASGMFVGLSRVALFASVLLGGCSADITRFDNASFGLTDSKPATDTNRRMANQSPPMPSAPIQGAEPGGAYFPPSSGRGTTSSGVSSQPLPEPGAGYAGSGSNGSFGQSSVQGSAGSPSVPFDRPKKARPVATAAAPAQPAKPVPASGSSIDVMQGDTLYGLARKHGVAVNELMTVNAMTSPTLKPGQKLILPANKSIARAVPTKAAPVAPAVAAAPAAVAVAAPAVAIAKPSKKPAAVAEVPAEAAPAVVPLAGKPVLLNGAPKQVAAVQPAGTVTDAPAPEAPVPAITGKAKGTEVASAAGAVGAATKFRWPVKGKVIANFGARTDGTHNDGVNVAVPQGTEVHAAEQGTVAYAGSELKGYGNLVLLRHESGWVTAYAHNEELLVKRGDKVKRGQAIAKAGKTGTVDQPQVHFELRQGQKPVDPAPHMEKM